MANHAKPVLWHLAISHYSEKVRWALDYKGVEHERRAPQPGLHMLVALGLTRAKHKTLPVLRLDGAPVGDSSAIIAALEASYPEPALFPADDQQRRRALELEEYFDEHLGPAMRLLAWHEVTHDRARLRELAVSQAPPALARFGGVAAAGARSFVNLRYGVRSGESAARAREQVAGALDRLEAELGHADYLVGDRFSVADLTAAALFYPLVLPAEGPRAMSDPPPPLERFRTELKDRRGFGWVKDMYRRYR